MAAKLSERSLLDQIGEDLVCHICLERLNDARNLRCQHCFCKDCLVDLAHDVQTIRCPTCRDINPLPWGGIDNLPRNFRVNNLVSLLEKREDDDNGEGAKCDGCEERTAARRCLDCAVSFCKPCANAHAKGKFKGHTQIPLAEYDSKSFNRRNKQLVEFCGKHGEQILDQVCQTCKIATCRQCVINEHSAPNHQLVPLNEALENTFLRLEIREGRLKQRKIQIVRRKASIERISGKMTAIHNTEKEKISKMLDENRQRVRDMTQRIIGRLERDANEKLDALSCDYIASSGVLQDELKEIQSAELKIDNTRALSADALRCQSVSNLLKTEEDVLCKMDEIITMTDDIRDREGSSVDRQQRDGSVISLDQRSKRRGIQNDGPRRITNTAGELTGLNFMRFVPDTTVENLERELESRDFTVGHLVHRTISEHSYHNETSSCNQQ